MNTETQPIGIETAVFSEIDKIFAVAMLICGFLYWNLIQVASLGMGVSIFALIVCTVIGIYLKKSGMHQTKESMICLGIIALASANFALFDNTITKNFNFIFLSVLVIYWICLSTGRRLDTNLSVYIIGDLINQSLIIPFSNMSCLFGALKLGISKNKHGKSFLNALIGILIFIPVMALVVSLLIDADAAFESLVANMNFSFSSNMMEYLLQIILSIPVAAYLYGLVYGDRYARHTHHITLESARKNASAMQFVPRITVYSGLTGLNAIYAVFFLAQTSYLFSAFVRHIPEAMTYAEYARRGFFELCAIAGINLFVILAAYVITNRKTENNGDAPKILRIETTVLCLFTLMLITTALSKMVMYINHYGLTQLRLYTTWFMILIFVIFIIVAVRQFRRFNSAKAIALSLIIGFVILSYANIDGLIAKYNIDRYRQGTLQSVDVQALAQLSDAAIPYLYELYGETKDEALKSQLKEAITGVYSWGVVALPYEPTFRDSNLQRYKADQIRAIFSSKVQI